jgi:hypothetical protein
VEHFITERMDFHDLKEERKRWIPEWKETVGVMETNDFIVPIQIEDVWVRREEKVYYHVTYGDGELIETITKGNYIVLRTKMNNPKEKAIEILSKVGLLYHREFESGNVEELVEKVMLKHLREYNYNPGTKTVHNLSARPFAAFHITKNTVILEDRDKNGPSSTKQTFVEKLEKALAKESMRTLLGG